MNVNYKFKTGQRFKFQGQYGTVIGAGPWPRCIDVVFDITGERRIIKDKDYKDIQVYNAKLKHYTVGRQVWTEDLAGNEHVCIIKDLLPNCLVLVSLKNKATIIVHDWEIYRIKFRPLKRKNFQLQHRIYLTLNEYELKAFGGEQGFKDAVTAMIKKRQMI
jgi:hypothetical protein